MRCHRQFGGLILACGVLSVLAMDRPAEAQSGSRIPFVMQDTFNGLNVSFGPTLTDPNRQKTIRSAHTLAQQQIRFAIQYLTQNRQRILAGKDTLFNKYFGDFYVRNNKYAGSYRQTRDIHRLSGRPIETDGVSVAGLAVTALQGSVWDFQLTQGDDVFLGTASTNPQLSAVGGSGRIQTYLGNAFLFDQFVNGVGRPRKVIGTEQQGDPSHLDQILNIFLAIESDMANGAVYNDGLAFNFAGNFQAGSQVFSPLAAQFRDIYGRDPDAGLMLAGFSNSNSSAHRGNILLSWYEDNAQSDGNPFYQNVMGVLGEQFSTGFIANLFVGGAFDRESTRFSGGFADSSISNAFNQQGTRNFDGSPKRRFQMIIQAFAARNGAINGIRDVMSAVGSDGSNQFYQSMDANSFAAFAGAIGAIPGGGTKGIVEPEGKRGSAGNFSPFIPVILIP